MTPFEAGRSAYHTGQGESANPYICGTTTLGNPKFSDYDRGCDWHNGWLADQARTASKREIEAAQSVDVSRFRKRRQ